MLNMLDFRLAYIEFLLPRLALTVAKNNIQRLLWFKTRNKIIYLFGNNFCRKENCLLGGKKI